MVGLMNPSNLDPHTQEAEIYGIQTSLGPSYTSPTGNRYYGEVVHVTVSSTALKSVAKRFPHVFFPKCYMKDHDPPSLHK